MRIRSLLGLAVLAAGGVGVGCGLNQQGVAPFNDTVYFPGSALVDPNGDWLYVANSNSDLRYNDGTLVALRLRDPGADPKDTIDHLRRRGWGDCPQIGYIHHHSDPNGDFCCWDPLDANILNCDERTLVNKDATVKIGSFAAGMVWQPVCPAPSDPPAAARAHCNDGCAADSPNGRLFLGVRGNSSVTYVDVKRTAGTSDIQMSCSAPGAVFAECDTDHQLETSDTSIGSVSLDPTATTVHLPDEPYALALDGQRQLLYVGHLRGVSTQPGSGGISLFDVVAPPAKPKFVWVEPSIFPPDASSLIGVTSLNQYDLSTGGEVFVTSRFVPRVGSVIPTTIPDSCDASIAPALLVSGDGFDTTLLGAEVRGVQFVPDAERVFALQRTPPALIGFDLGQDPAGAMRVTPSEVLETCASPTFLQSHNAGGAGTRLFVSCFESGQLYVVDPYVPRVTNVIDVGHGPAGLAFGPGPNDPAGTPADRVTRAYVVGFSDNNISVIDLEPGSPTQLHVVMRIGFQSTVPR